jgi:predicted ATPase
VLVGLRMWYFARAEIQVAHELSERLLHLAQHVQDPALLLEAHRSMGVTWFCQGELARARTHLEHGIALATSSPVPVPSGDRPVPAPWVSPAVGYYVDAALVLWALGYADQALWRGQEALRLAQLLAHPVGEATVRYMLSILHVFRGEGLAAQQQAEASLRLAADHDAADRAAQSRIQCGGALVLQGHTDAGIAQLTQGLAATRAIGYVVFLPYFLSLLAAAYGHAGQPHAGLQVLTEAHAVVEQSGERWWQAERHRLQGALLLQQDDANAAPAETCFQQALAIARRQQAKLLELRAAVSLSRLWQQQDKQAEAQQLLSDVYSWFTEGFETPDLQAAARLLQALQRAC